MSSPRLEDAEFAPAPIRGRRRGDAVASGLVVVVVIALAVAVAKPWEQGGGAAASAGPSPTAGRTAAAGGGPASPPPGPIVVAPTWADVGPVISGHDAWGIRAITVDAGYHELWEPATRTSTDQAASAMIAPGSARVVALGVTFPPAETPLDVRAWLDHGLDGQEWLATRPVNDLAGLGAYLLVRPGADASAALRWAPGRYRLDVLVGHAIRRLWVEIRDTTGTPAPDRPWPEPSLGLGDVPVADVASAGVGAFAWNGTPAAAVSADAGPNLDETDAWLDLDRVDVAGSPRSFVGKVFMPDAAALGVALPPSSDVRVATIRMLAPSGPAAADDPSSGLVSTGVTSFVAFSRSSGAAWRPGVYALRVAWLDGAGSHDRTWHLELLPGPLQPEPWLLAATRAWAHLAGVTGVLIGITSDAPDGAPSTEVRLLEVSPQDGSTYPGLAGLKLLGCGATLIRGHPTVVGFVAPRGFPVTPVGAAIQYPFYAVGTMSILESTGAVPGLTVVTPRATGAFEGPAAYGFRVGPSPDSPTYTVCIDMQPLR
jgi:hypothetical protein